MQSHKTREYRITVWSFDNSDKHDNSDKTVPLPITPRYWEAGKVLFMMWGDLIIGSLYHKTSHYSTRHSNDGKESSEKEVTEVSLGEKSCGHRSLETSQYSSINHGGPES